jgi:hypothetical protein
MPSVGQSPSAQVDDGHAARDEEAEAKDQRPFAREAQAQGAQEAGT